MLLAGVFASSKINPAVSVNGLIYGEYRLFMAQLLAMICVSAFAYFGTFLLLRVVNFISPLRVSEEEEREGLDWSQHRERL